MSETNMDRARVAGFCPACGAKSLCLSLGRLVCGRMDCPRPDAAAQLLADPETEHVVVLGAKEFTVRHPLIERIDDALLSCDLHRHIAALDGPPHPPGRYRVRHDSGAWQWETMPETDHPYHMVEPPVTRRKHLDLHGACECECGRCLDGGPCVCADCSGGLDHEHTADTAKETL